MEGTTTEFRNVSTFHPIGRIAYEQSDHWNRTLEVIGWIPIELSKFLLVASVASSRTANKYL